MYQNQRLTILTKYEKIQMLLLRQFMAGNYKKEDLVSQINGGVDQ
jgi:hypothetical protein